MSASCTPAFILCTQRTCARLDWLGSCPTRLDPAARSPSRLAQRTPAMASAEIRYARLSPAALEMHRVYIDCVVDSVS